MNVEHGTNIVKLGFLVFCCGLIASQSCLAQEQREELRQERTISFRYKVIVDTSGIAEAPLDVFLPLAKSDEHQDVIQRKIVSSIPGQEKKEPVYGNEFWHAHLNSSQGKVVTVEVDYLVKRRMFQQELLPQLKHETFTAKDLQGENLFLRANSHVPISGKLIEKVQKDLPRTENFPLLRAQAIYDYVIDTMEYKKVGKGWGNGDTHWACSKRYGNCTDFHALFISLARAENIPAKFEIGFPIPEDMSQGKIKGYHCWVTFKLPELGWTPIDASEAKKHPEKRKLFFGTHPADRIKFTEGRDLKLGEGHTTRPLNYFVYPHVELGGKKHERVWTEFSFKELS